MEPTQIMMKMHANAEGGRGPLADCTTCYGCSNGDFGHLKYSWRVLWVLLFVLFYCSKRTNGNKNVTHNIYLKATNYGSRFKLHRSFSLSRREGSTSLLYWRELQYEGSSCKVRRLAAVRRRTLAESERCERT